MAVAGGPNLSENGLVFYYDTDNGKSYKGEPTTNYAAGRAFTGNSPNVTTTTVEDTLPDGSRGTVYEMNCQIVGDANRTISVGSFDVPANTTVTLSFYVKNIDCTGFGGNLYTPTLGRVLGGITYPTVYTDRWVRVETTYLIPDEGHATVTTSPQLFRDAGIGRLRMTQPQFEYKSHATQYVDGSRSATESLYDFIGDGAIDVSNVSFDSNADITFDGSNDYVSLGDNSAWDFGQNGTLEMVVRPTNSTVNDRLWCIDNNSSNLDAYLNGSSYNVYMHGGVVGTTTPLTQNQYNHLAVVYNGGTIQIYVNGTAGTMTGTTTGYSITNPSANNSNLYLGCYRDLGYNLYGDINLFKIYNRALTAEEVQNNFNGIRSRFGI